MSLTVGSLFAGIGGLELGLERTGGFRTVWQVEVDGYCSRVLAKHWPDVTRYGDIRNVYWRDVERVDVITAGWPCQNLSHVSVDRSGLGGAKSGLWTHVTEAIRDLGPRYVLLENVTGILAGGLGGVLGSLAAIGYDAEWDCLPAAAFGAPHLRARIWILAYPSSRRHGPSQAPVFAGRPVAESHGWWAHEPPVARVAYGLPGAVDSRRALGNSVVPQVAEHIGRLILDAEQSPATAEARSEAPREVVSGRALGAAGPQEPDHPTGCRRTRPTAPQEAS